MRLTILFPLLLCMTSLNAQEIAKINGVVKAETDPERTLISKPGWLRGLHVSGTSLPSEVRPKIYVDLPESWFGETVCARITTITGDYDAMVQFEIPNTPKSRLAEFYFSSDYIEMITNATPQDSGIAIERGDCIGDTTETSREFVANFWNEFAPESDDAETRVVLNMNIARADEVLPNAQLSFGNGAQSHDLSPSTYCYPLTSSEALAFNYRCEIDFDPALLVNQAAPRIDFSYSRLYRGRESAVRKASILIGARQ